MSSEMLLAVRDVFAGYGDGDVLRGVNLDAFFKIVRAETPKYKEWLTTV